MNILVPDSNLRQFLNTKATPEKIKEYVSLCGPSVERIHHKNGETVYDIEITTNRPDSMSIAGVAREASAILPRFGIPATLINNPYDIKLQNVTGPLQITIKTDSDLNPRWSCVIMDSITVGTSPDWLKKFLESVDIRSINTIVDITNFIMVMYGQPAHAFDYDRIGKKGHTPYMHLRASRPGEKITTLDGKVHTLPGDDIVIEDGSGNLIDLCGIMGGQNSSITPSTKRIVLFMQTYDPLHIRRTSMKLSHRTQAAALFEKGIDTELVMPALLKGIELVKKIAHGTIASKIIDLYPKPFKSYRVSVTRHKIAAYLGTTLPDTLIRDILTSLSLQPTFHETEISVLVPSFRRDITIDVDIIEELARIYGYHNVQSHLPEHEPPATLPDTLLMTEQMIKERLRDWGYTETYSYSMISEKRMDVFGFDKKKCYKIQNPLSSDWVYMRPSILPGILQVIEQNLNIRDYLELFELSMVYRFQPHALPDEIPTLLVAWSGAHFYRAKGLVQALFALAHIPFPPYEQQQIEHMKSDASLSLGSYGFIGEVDESILRAFHIHKPVTIVQLDIRAFASRMSTHATYTPVPKFPPSFEDIAFTVPEHTQIGLIIDALTRVHPLITNISLLDAHESTRTLHVTYQSDSKNLTAEDIRPIRAKLLKLAKSKFNLELKASLTA